MEFGVKKPLQQQFMAEQLLADLVWVVNSPSLIVSSRETHPIAETDVDLDRLVNFFDDQLPRRVGFYFERLVLFWLIHVRRVEMVAHGKPIRDGSLTLGELDFLFRDEVGRLTHLEVAVKFYLHYAESLIAGSHFVGPNVKDTFERKMKRMFDHQLQLGRKHVEGVEIQEPMVKGRIFYSTFDSPSGEPPALLSPDHLRARWVTHHEFDAISLSDSFRYRVLLKPFWLSADQTAQHDWGLMTKQQINDYYNDSNKKNRASVLISQLIKSEGGWTETKRFFVMANDWPMG
jgi:hypothetical protein